MLYEVITDYSFELFPSSFNDPGLTVTSHQKALVQEYLFDIAKAYRKNFYTGYVAGSREGVELLSTHFYIEAKYHYYEIGKSISTSADSIHEDLDDDDMRTIKDAKLLIKRELSENRPLWMYATRACVGEKVESRHWSEGWTTANFYTIDDTTYLFLLKERGTDHEGNNVYIYEMKSDGTVGKKRDYELWSEGWSYNFV